MSKAKYSDFPTYENLRQTLVFMKQHAIKNQVGHIAMPKIGCGLDKGFHKQQQCKCFMNEIF